MPGPTHATTLEETIPQFDKDIRDVHLIYDYDAKSPEGKPEKWRYEMFVPRLLLKYLRISHFLSQVMNLSSQP
jgi:hypothetical protein